MRGSNLVMIIDDSQTVRKILEVCLKRAGIPWTSYANGAEALRALNRQPDLVPAVVILDVRLPDLDGFALARLLRAQPTFDATAIVFLTGHDSILNRLRARLAGGSHYLTKPFTTQEILSVVPASVPQALDTGQQASESINTGGSYALPRVS